MSDPFILCDGLVKIYKVAGIEQVALLELNLSVESGELIAIVGRSGSGKTTLMNILGGLDRPSAGRMRVGGLDLLRLNDRQLNQYRREKVGFVWQQSARNLVPYLNAIDNVILPMTLAGVRCNHRRRAADLLEMIGLGERLCHYLPELSGGEQQRVAIAVALSNHPSLLLADEPTGEVDTMTAAVIYEIFRRLSSDMGVTTVIVSHDPDVARQVGRVVLLRDGMLASETSRQAIAQPADNGARNHGNNDNNVVIDQTTNTNSQIEVHAQHHFEELVVLDRAGRVHVPAELLELFKIRGRARLEVTEDGILLRPVSQDCIEAEIAKPTSIDFEAKTEGSGGKLRNLLARFRRNRE